MSDPSAKDPSSVRRVVLVHGLWFRATFMGVLARRLERRGYSVLPFNYRTTRTPLERNARRLRLTLERQAPGGAHLVGHSLGGLLLLHMLAREGWTAPGRLLLLGTPLQGSAVARAARSWPASELAFGHAEGPLHRGHGQPGEGAWPADRDSGMIAGDRPFGLGLLTGALEKPHDGTVAVAETRHPGLDDHIVLPVTHTGMIYARESARQAGIFLARGRFDHDDDEASGSRSGDER
jgi:pimeloyl-ACP methyl ester carboxylesterase